MSAEDQSVEKSSLWSRAGDVLEDVGFVIYRAVLGMMQSNVTIMASGLVYSTLVAIVPCMTFCIAFLTTFGILQPFMDALGEHIHTFFLAKKRDEWNKFASTVTEWEVRHYLANS